MHLATRILRPAGAVLAMVALVPWLGVGTASAAVTVYVAQKWDGTSSSTAQVSVAGCSFAEVTSVHSGQGWHFVLPGGSGLTQFTAHFVTAGDVTVTTTETAAGVIVQGGKGAVVWTPGPDTLTSAPTTGGYPGMGTAATKGANDMQLSHLCGGGDTPPVDECTNLEGAQSQVPDGYTQNEDGTCSVGTPQETTSSSTSTSSTSTSTSSTTASASTETSATSEETTAGAGASSASSPPPVADGNGAEVEGTKTGIAAAEGDTSADVAVEGTKAGAPLPHTGSSLPFSALAVLSAGLLLLGGSLMLLPGLPGFPSERTRRRH